MKKKSAASTQSVRELGPAAAAVASQRKLRTATTLNNTRSRRPRVRGRALGSEMGAALRAGSDWRFQIELREELKPIDNWKLVIGNWQQRCLRLVAYGLWLTAYGLRLFSDG